MFNLLFSLGIKQAFKLLPRLLSAINYLYLYCILYVFSACIFVFAVNKVFIIIIKSFYFTRGIRLMLTRYKVIFPSITN